MTRHLRTARTLATLKGVGYFGSLIGAFDLLARIERGWGKRARSYNAAHPPPPGFQRGPTWVAKREDRK